MINSLKLIRNIGRFDSVTTSPDLSFSQLTLIYAENGQGKTTISSILRSLSTGNPIPISERHRLAAPHPSHAVVDCTGGPPDAIFENGAWNRSLADIMIFDDVFIDENVYSGLVVGSDHRQNLHELILGDRGVALNKQLQMLVDRIEKHITEIRRCEGAIPTNERGMYSVDDFCALPVNPNIDQEIQATEQNLAASRQQDPIRNTQDLPLLQLPEIDLVAIETVLGSGFSDIDTAAAKHVQEHLKNIGDNAERWIAEGMERQNAVQEDEENKCVFCAQNLSGSTVITHYRAFFSEAYRNHQQSIRTVISSFNQIHSADKAPTFERSVSTLIERRRFWCEFGDIPEIAIDSVAITTDWNAARMQVIRLLEKKKEMPLDAITITDEVRLLVNAYTKRQNEVATLNQKLLAANQTIVAIKQRSLSANTHALSAKLAQLKVTKARHMPATAGLCTAYLNEKRAKTVTEQQRDHARQDLEQYRTQVFPTYEAAINRYLDKFSVGYRLNSVKAKNMRSGSTCTYNVVVNNISVIVGGGNPNPGDHSFKNVLSSGDRNTLAVAFFLASIELDLNQANKVVVIDDPVSSMDEHRSLTTAQEVRQLVNRVAQVVILSHSKPFLCKIWKNTTTTPRKALQIVRQGTTSTIVAWDPNSDSATDNDQRHQMLRDYLENGGQNKREIAAAIRLCLEAFFRVTYPEYFPPGTLLGRFCEICSSQAGTEQEILSQTDIDELRNLTGYTNQFHHDTNSAWETGEISSNELTRFVERTLKFIKRH